MIVRTGSSAIAAASTEVHVLRSRPGVDPRFIRYSLLTARFLEEGATAQQGVAGLQRVPDDFLANFRVRDVTLDEQRRIANLLDDQVARLDAAYEQLDELVSQVHAAAQTEIADLVSGHGFAGPRDGKGAMGLPASPAEWPVVKLSLLARMGSGHTPSRSNDEYWENADLPWVTTTDVKHLRSDGIDEIYDTEVTISSQGLHNSAAELHPAGTVHLCRTSNSAGYSVVAGRSMATSQDFVTWTCGRRLLPHYLLWILRTARPYLLDYLAMGSTHKTLYFPDLAALRLPVPPLREQDRIVTEVRRVRDRRCDVQAEARRLQVLLRERKRALITKCISGN